MYWMLRPWRQALDFKGRATRREFWLLQLQIMALWIGGALALGGTVRSLDTPAVAGPLSLLFLALIVFLVIVGLSAAVRRLHDHDKTGWMYLLALVPLIGWIFFLIMMLTPGTRGENSYGVDPREEALVSGDRLESVFS